jgi:hypothetical protein
MARGNSLGRNSPCPCGSQLKYKDCCEGKVPWEELRSRRPQEIPYHLTVRGKNLAFLRLAFEALGLDITRPYTWTDVKNAITPAVVEEIYKARILLWPDRHDYHRILEEGKSRVSGLYLGQYEPERILRGVTRHALYSDQIVLADPFPDPRIIRPEFNPLERPAEHMSNTLKYLYLWVQLAKWIEAGIVAFIPSPGQFDVALKLECLALDRARHDSSPELQSQLKRDTEQDSASERLLREYLYLQQPDDQIRRSFLDHNPGSSDADADQYITHVHRMRRDHPFFIDLIERGVSGEFASIFAGADYEMSKIMANQLGSHLITDMPYRWLEIRLDRDGISDPSGWLEFGKSFGSLEFPFLDDVPLDIARRMRLRGHLERLRGFFNRVWRAAEGEEPLDESNVQNLAAEMRHEMAEADEEWREIDRDLAKWLGPGVVGAAVAIASGDFMPAVAFAAGGAAKLMVAGDRRRSLPRRRPAALLLQLERSSK